MYGTFGKGLRENYKPFLQNSVGLTDLFVLIKVDKDDSLQLPKGVGATPTG